MIVHTQYIVLPSGSSTVVGWPWYKSGVPCATMTWRAASFERSTVGGNRSFFARTGDTLVIWKLDRLGRSLRDLIEIVNRLEKRSVSFVCLTQNIDTRTPGGKLFFHIFGALAEYERELIRERTKAGLTAARARGRKGGRKPAMNAEEIEQARAMMNNPKLKIKSIIKTLGISKATLYKYVPMGKSVSENKK